MTTEAGFKLRPYQQTDIPLIQNSWGSSYYKGAEYNKFLSPKEFNNKHRPIRESILSKPTTAVIIACNAEDEDHILGWMVIEKPMKTKGTILHYIYIKEAFKGEGIAEALLDKLKETPIILTHMTDRARKIIAKKHEQFEPYVFSPEPIMLRDNYLKTLPQLDHYESKGEM